MFEIGVSGVMLVLLLGCAAAGMAFRPFLPVAHRGRAAIEAIGLVIGLLVGFASLVLGLLTYSAKGSFDAIQNDLRGYSVRLIQLNRSLREYGPETDPVRVLLRRYTEAAIASTWTDETPPPGDDYPRNVPTVGPDSIESRDLGRMLDAVETAIRALSPQDALHRQLAEDCIDLFKGVMEVRWKLIEETHGSISLPFLAVLALWLGVIFICFGLIFPPSPLAFAMLALCAVSVASAVWIILDLDTPLTGVLVVSSQPMRDALAHMAAPALSRP